MRHLEIRRLRRIEALWLLAALLVAGQAIYLAVHGRWSLVALAVVTLAICAFVFRRTKRSVDEEERKW